MRIAASLLLTCGMLAACATPVITGAGPDNVTLRYDPALYTRDDMQARAEAYCGEQGFAAAAFVTSTQATWADFRHDVFHCRRS